MSRSAGSKIKYTTDILSLIDPTIHALIFQTPNQGAIVSVENANEQITKDALPGLGVVTIKLAAILLMAFSIALRVNKRSDEIPPDMDDIIQQIWGGIHTCSEGLCLSLLQTASMAPTSSPFRRLVNNQEIFIKWSEFINYRKWDYKKFDTEISNNDFYNLYKDLVKELPILKETRYEIKKKKHVFIFNAYDSEEESRQYELKSYFFIKYSDLISNPLYLFSFENVKKNPIVIFEDPYSDYTEIFNIEVNSVFNYETFHHFRRLTCGDNDVREGVLYLFGNEYDYLKNLAKAVTETKTEESEYVLKELKNFYGLSAESTKALREEFKKYDNMTGEEKKRLDRDYILLLLAENGPKDIVDRIFEFGKKRLIYDYLDYYEKTLLSDANSWKNKLRSRIDSSRLQIRKYFSNYNMKSRDDMWDDREKDIYAWCLISAAGLKLFETPAYIESIAHKLQIIKDIYNGYKRTDDADKLEAGAIAVIQVNKVLENTIRFLICFYYGLKSYYEQSLSSPGNYDLLEETMLGASAAKFQDVSQLPLGKLFEEFRYIIDRDTIKSDFVNCLLGRKEVCDYIAFKNITNEPYLSIVGSTKHYKEKNWNKDIISDFIGRNIDLFRLFQYGNVNIDPDKVDFTMRPVYPMIISFEEVRRKKGGMVIYSYELSSVGHRNTKVPSVRILTPREYDPRDSYYCIPNYTHSTDKWWLDPFIIECAKFDGLFKYRESN